MAPLVPCWPQTPHRLASRPCSGLLSVPTTQPCALNCVLLAYRTRECQFALATPSPEFPLHFSPQGLHATTESRILRSGASGSLETEPGPGSHALSVQRGLSLTKSFYRPGCCSHSPRSAGASPTGSSPTGSHCKKAFGLHVPEVQ